MMGSIVAVIAGALFEAGYIARAFVVVWSRRAWRHLNGYDQRW